MKYPNFQGVEEDCLFQNIMLWSSNSYKKKLCASCKISF